MLLFSRPIFRHGFSRTLLKYENSILVIVNNGRERSPDRFATHRGGVFGRCVRSFRWAVADETANEFSNYWRPKIGWREKSVRGVIRFAALHHPRRFRSRPRNRVVVVPTRNPVASLSGHKSFTGFSVYRFERWSRVMYVRRTVVANATHGGKIRFSVF